MKGCNISFTLAQFALYFAHLRERCVCVCVCVRVCTVIHVRVFPTVLTANVLLLRTDIMAGNLCHDGWY